jgi:FtsH-binding integral membrane protein
MSDFDRQQHSYSQPEAWAARGGAATPPLTAAEASVGERVGFIRKVYALFFAATLFAIGGVLLGLAYPPLMIAAAQHPIIMFLLMIGGVLGAQAVRHVPGVNLAALFGFTTLTGVIISPLLFDRQDQPRFDTSSRRYDRGDFWRADGLRVRLASRL